MIITFEELGVLGKDYNGMRTVTARAEIINVACDYVMTHFFPGQNEMDVIKDPEFAFVNFNVGMISLDTATPKVH